MNKQDIDHIRQTALAELRKHDWNADARRGIPDAATQAVNSVLDAILAIDATQEPLRLFEAVEQLAYGAPTISHAILPTAQASLLISQCGSEEQRRHLLPLLAKKGGNAACLLFQEGEGRGPSEWECTANRDGNDWIVSGRKTTINDNGGDVFVVVAKTQNDQVQAFALSSRPAALSLRNSQASPALGLGASHLTSIDLDSLQLAADSALEADSVTTARAVGLCRLLLGSVSTGVAAASLDYARDWVKKRTAFGKPLAAFEGVAFDIADADTKVQAVKLNLVQAAHDVQSLTDLEGIDDLVARTLARTTSICASAAIDGVQLMGVHGIIHEHPQELFHRVASSLSVLDTDPARSAFELV